MMKKISQLSFLLLAVAFSSALFAGELTGAGARALLVKHGIDPRGLEQSGAKILAGELTGAGKTADIKRIQYVMTNAEVFNMEEVRHIELNARGERNGREGRVEHTTLQDVRYLEINERKLLQQSIQGLVIK